VVNLRLASWRLLSVHGRLLLLAHRKRRNCIVKVQRGWRAVWHTEQGADVALQTAQANSPSLISLKAAENVLF